ncbi:trypsin-7-like [Anoplophora glabripennis]|uniref:trypsin-7-like n=1 Tax=Anoplophora glabripennis TaxID=217634 RepID=UPI000C766F02|nr:trypsin-7-like [Anoplophora glabripennis]
MFRLILTTAAFAGLIWGAPQLSLEGLDIDGRIVGGNNTTIETHPYIVSVQELNNHVCGGSIIAANWILSAAHCFTANTTAYSIRAGSTFRNTGGQVINVSRIIIHQSHNRATLDYDIALLQLNSSITTIAARAVSLAAQGGAPLAGTTATVTGWGALSEDGPLASILQVINVPIISQANCRIAYGQNTITDRMFCAGVLGVGGKDACFNDAGGPLIAGGMLTGIVSWGYGCALPNYPGVYASVPNLRTWIRNVTGL